MRNRSRMIGVIMLLFGVMALVSSLNKPRVKPLHVPDILGLIGSGMCFGVALGALLGRLRFPEN